MPMRWWRGIARLHPFEISVAAYPETHPEAASAQADLDALKRKIDAGACRALAQFCFDLDAFERFLDRAARAGIDAPIVPGILPIADIARTRELAARCGAHLPHRLVRQFEGLDGDPAGRRGAATCLAIEQCAAFHRLGIRQFHFYTLNRAEPTLDICRALGIEAAAARPTGN